MVATLGLVVAGSFWWIPRPQRRLLNDARSQSFRRARPRHLLARHALAERPADRDKTYGYHRAGTLAAFTNAVVLVLLSAWLGYEAIERLRAPVAVVESWMIWTSLAALAVNGGITLASCVATRTLISAASSFTISATLSPTSPSSRRHRHSLHRPQLD